MVFIGELLIPAPAYLSYCFFSKEVIDRWLEEEPETRYVPQTRNFPIALNQSLSSSYRKAERKESPRCGDSDLFSTKSQLPSKTIKMD